MKIIAAIVLICFATLLGNSCKTPVPPLVKKESIDLCAIISDTLSCDAYLEKIESMIKKLGYHRQRNRYFREQSIGFNIPGTR